MNRRAIKIRLYPEQEVQTEVDKILGCARFIYNHCLNLRTTAYETDRTSLNISALNQEIIRLKNTEEYSWLKNANSKVMQQSINNLDVAFQRFFKGVSGYPNFKLKSNENKCRFPSDAIIGVCGNRISLTRKINNILFKCSVRDEKYLNTNKKHIKSATLTKTKSGKYMLSVLLEGCPNTNKKLKKSKKKNIDNKIKAVGIDTGIKEFVVTDDGIKYKNLKSIRNNEKKLAKLQRGFSRKKKFAKTETVDGNEVPCLDRSGKPIYVRSKNKEKARLKLAKFQEGLTDKKLNYIHSVVNKLLNENQVIAMEDLNVKGMLSNHKLARSIQELSIGEFNTILKYKAEWYGRTVITIDRWFPSSKLCHCCDWKNDKLKLTDREWVCKNCGVIHDRDINAAINIKREAIRILRFMLEHEREIMIKLGLSKPEFTLVENSNVDDPAQCESIAR